MVLVSFKKTTRDYYTEELKTFFGKYAEVTGYSTEEGIGDLSDADLVLLTGIGIKDTMKIHTYTKGNIIYMKRTYSNAAFKKLTEVPPGTTAMFVCNDQFSAYESVAIINSIGNCNIDLVPVYPEMDDVPKLDYAITPAQVQYVPKEITNVVDIGWRVISTSTMFDIATNLNVLNKKLYDEIISRQSDIMPVNMGMEYLIENTHQIRNMTREGIVYTDDDFKIRNYNDTVLQSSNVAQYMGQNIIGTLIPEEYKDVFVGNQNVENILFEHPATKKVLEVSKRALVIHDKQFGYIFKIEDQTEIKALELRLKNEMSSRGHVARYTFKDILGGSKAIEECKKKAIKIAQLDNVVLITGESGSGKELFAQSMHNASKRNKMPFLAINCSALHPHLLESELFGYEEGAFSGAKKGGKKGLFELANKGTLFLDEIGELPLEVQAKFLRVLQEKELIRVGGSDIISVDVRIIAATNRSLPERVANGEFRKDLYYRLNVFPLMIPNLKERKEDVLPLAYQFLKEFDASDKIFDPALVRFLTDYGWPGNIRELRNCIEYMAYMGECELTLADLPSSINLEKVSSAGTCGSFSGDALTKSERSICLCILKNLDNKRLGRRALYKKLMESGYDTTEYEVRKLLQYLTENAYIEALPGVKGAKVTGKGRLLLEDNI